MSNDVIYTYRYCSWRFSGRTQGNQTLHQGHTNELFRFNPAAVSSIQR